MLLRMFLTQTKMNFVWYFQRDGEMIFWTLAMPVFFLVLFSFAFSTGPNSGASSFLVPGHHRRASAELGILGRRRDARDVPGEAPAAAGLPHADAAVDIFCRARGLPRSVVGRASDDSGHRRGTRLPRADRRQPLEIGAILLLGTATFVSLGTIIGALARTTESANNIASVLSVPLAFLSDAYVPIDRFPHAVSSTLRLLPSTQFIDTFRDVSVYGHPLAQYGAWIIVLVLWTLAGTAISARTFRWV